jgi:hypothetical protein
MNSLNTSSGDAQQQQRRGRGRRRRPRPTVATISNKLNRYLNEPPVDPGPYNGDAITWWRNFGWQRFPRLSFLASDLLSIPASTVTIERQFSQIGRMVSPTRNRFRAQIINQAQCLSSWRQHNVYTPTESWQHLSQLVD